MLTNETKDSISERLQVVYGQDKADTVLQGIEQLISKYSPEIDPPAKKWVDEKDVMLITYGDSIQEAEKAPLLTLDEFLKENVDNVINAVHILPFYPYTSDDGFSVSDYLAVNEKLGNWEDIKRLSQDFDLMFDAVINHISQKSEWFQKFLKGERPYRDYFLEADPNADYSSVTRPRALPLLTRFETHDGEKYIWTTFSEDQIDLNYESPELFLNILEILLVYVQKGARFLRLDAIGFLWKQLGTTCIHLEQTHKIVQVMRTVLETAVPGTIIITETNVPHEDNISYFGNGHNEAHLVYQFPLPPLTLNAFHTGNAGYLSDWASSLEPTTKNTTFFNFLASHDGIGVRPVEGILSPEEVGDMADKVKAHGGFVSMKDNGDGTQSPYELNINYLDALSHPEDPTDLKVKRFLAAQSILLTMAGVPGIYIHSLLGSRNDLEGVKETGRYRSINREKLNLSILESELNERDHLRHKVFSGFKNMIKIRRSQKAFHPNSDQRVLQIDDRVFSLVRTHDETEQLIYAVNTANEEVNVKIKIGQINNHAKVKDLYSGQEFKAENDELSLTLSPYQFVWLRG